MDRVNNYYTGATHITKVFVKRTFCFCCVIVLHRIMFSTCGYTGVPTEPGNLTVTVGQGHLKVQWTAPHVHPGYSILSYTLQIHNSENTSIPKQLSGNTTDYVVNTTNIGTDCDVLTVFLTAWNSLGKGTPAVSEVTLPICKKCCSLLTHMR